MLRIHDFLVLKHLVHFLHETFALVREIKRLLAFKDEAALTQDLVFLLGEVKVSLQESCLASRGEVVHNATDFFSLWEEISDFYGNILDGDVGAIR